MTNAEGEWNLPSVNGSAGSGENWAPAGCRLTCLSPPELWPSELSLSFLLSCWVKIKVALKCFSEPALTPEPSTDVWRPAGYPMPGKKCHLQVQMPQGHPERSLQSFLRWQHPIPEGQPSNHTNGSPQDVLQNVCKGLVSREGNSKHPKLPGSCPSQTLGTLGRFLAFPRLGMG